MVLKHCPISNNNVGKQIMTKKGPSLLLVLVCEHFLCPLSTEENLRVFRNNFVKGAPDLIKLFSHLTNRQSNYIFWSTQNEFFGLNAGPVTPVFAMHIG